MNTEPSPRPESPQPDSTPPSIWGRWLCGLFLLTVLVPALMKAGLLAALILLLLWGGIPAVLLMCFPPRGNEYWDNVLYGLAIGALFLIFVGYMTYAQEVARSDAQGALIYIFAFPWTHGIWSLFGIPHFIRRGRQAGS